MKPAPFQFGDKVIFIPRDEEMLVVYQYKNEDGDDWGNVRLCDKEGRISNTNNWQIRKV